MSQPIKSKRGRKSKKELLASLNINYDTNTKLDNVTNTNNNINLNIIETTQDNEIFHTDCESIITTDLSINENDNKQLPKKRGRKPKGGKIIQNIVTTNNKTNDSPNVILHLKCSMKELNNINTDNINSFDINITNKLSFDTINNSQNIESIDSYFNTSNINSTNSNNTNYVIDNNDDDNIQELWKKVKQLEYNLHINNINNKRSACFWDTCNFDNPPIYIPKHFIGETYHVYGCFCSPECAVAFLMNENIDTSTKFERYHLLNHIYSKVYDYKNNIKPAPNPYYMLDKYYGNLSIQEYRSLLRNERLFLIVDKPLTRIMPELHEDNEEFILNNKIIPSNNNYQLKQRIQKKKQIKTAIVNENFGINNELE
jgi:hypothetical protein